MAFSQSGRAAYASESKLHYQRLPAYGAASVPRDAARALRAKTEHARAGPVQAQSSPGPPAPLVRACLAFRFSSMPMRT
jgi:hypothetical protein